jgi:hypothetical protein
LTPLTAVDRVRELVSELAEQWVARTHGDRERIDPERPDERPHGLW